MLCSHRRFTPVAGAIGRLTVLKNEGLVLDLKGHQYAGSIVPCATFMVVQVRVCLWLHSCAAFAILHQPASARS
jgi:hypothetical protein